MYISTINKFLREGSINLGAYISRLNYHHYDYIITVVSLSISVFANGRKKLSEKAICSLLVYYLCPFHRLPLDGIRDDGQVEIVIQVFPVLDRVDISAIHRLSFRHAPNGKVMCRLVHLQNRFPTLKMRCISVYLNLCFIRILYQTNATKQHL